MDSEPVEKNKLVSFDASNGQIIERELTEEEIEEIKCS